MTDASDDRNELRMLHTEPIQSWLIGLFALVLGFATEACGDDWSKAIAEMTPFQGRSVSGVNTKTLTGKIVAGYQGWFSTPDDGYQCDWRHYSRDGRFRPGACSIDYWPHTADFPPSLRVATPFEKKDGSTAYVFSSAQPAVVDKHFQWMKQYGIEAVFLQRFNAARRNARLFRRNNRVLDNVRAAANAHGRAYALMYDLSGTGPNQLHRIKDDWKLLVDHMRLTKDPRDRAYLHHRGKPIVAVWGAGFRDRDYTMDEILDFVRFLKEDPKYGGVTVMLGVPTGWRQLTRDCIKDPKLHEVIGASDIVSPWTVGRFRTIRQVKDHARKYWMADLAWCRKENLDYLPVVFPGFSWANLKDEKLDAISRVGGHFLWEQYATLIAGGASMIYQAMFDEIDEGTAILKVDNDPPIGASRFLSYHPQPEDHYLWLVGQAQRMLRNPRTLTPALPHRPGHEYPAKTEP